MNYVMIFQLLGGLGLFVYGMKLMGDGLQKAAGEKLKRILEILTSNRILAVLVGAGVTAIIQSSSATTVMTVGFVNAGLMNLFQAAGVIMGANIGTTMTAQLIAFKLSDIAPLILGIGAAIVLFAKKKKSKDIGEIILGFGILFVGMEMMSDSMHPLREMESFKNLILALGKHPLLGVLVGLGMTAVVQSSSATIGILMALAGTNAITLNVALPILFGDNMGTCVTALLASIGTTKNAKRASLIHLTFNTIGTIIFMLCLGIVLKVVPMLGGDVQRQIANAHTIFNFTNVILQVPFIPILVKFVNKLVPGDDKMTGDYSLEYLDKRILETPSIASAQLVKEIVRMGKISSENLTNSIQTFLNNDEKLMSSVFEQEKLINFLQREITDYMVLLANTDLSQEQSSLVSSLFHVVSDIERIGDHAKNIVELAELKINDSSIVFSKKAIEDTQNMYEAASHAVNCVIKALEDFDFKMAEEAVETEGKIDAMEEQFRKEHFDRLNQRECNTAGSAIFIDLVTNLERIGDHSNNIALMILDRR